MVNIELSITDRCNLGCKYCYVKNRNSTMTKSTLLKCFPKIHQYVKRFKETEYSISYFGGEPLMNFELIKFAYEIFSKDPMCKEQSIISNGTLVTQEIYDWIKSHKIGFSWSFDGIDSNNSRPLLPIVENQGAKDILSVFEHQKEMLLDLSNHGAHVMIYPENVAKMFENFGYLYNVWNIKNIGFTIVRDDVWNNQSIDIFRTQFHNLCLIYTDMLKHNKDVSISLIDNWINDVYCGLKGMKFTAMCFAGCSGMGISPDGEFYGCQRFASNKQFKLSEYNLGNIAKYADISTFEKCKTCDIRKFCRNLCKYSIIKNNNQPIESICEIYHIIVYEVSNIIHELRDNKRLSNKITFF